MRKKQQSVLDTLLRILPNKKTTAHNKNYVDPKAAKTLFSIWRTAENKIKENVYKRPSTISLSDIEIMQKEGLVKSIGSNIEITNRGQKVIKVMILGDSRSSFDKDGEVIIDYNTALNNTKDLKIAIRGRKKKVDWKDVFKGKK